MSSEVDPKGLEAARAAMTEWLRSRSIYDAGIMSFHGDQLAHAAIQAYRSASPSIGRVGVEPLHWREIGPKGSDIEAETVLGTYTISFDAPSAGGARNLWMAGADTDTFSVHDKTADAMNAAQADYESRIRSTLVYREEPAGDTQGAGATVLGRDDDLNRVAHALDIGSIGTPYRAYQGSVYCDYQSHRIADFQDYGLALAATVLFNNAKAIKAALVSPPDNGGWMPIETAPKDGTQALGFVPSYFQGKGGQAVILWLNGRWMDGRAWAVSPTHWQPLPSPPALQSHNEGRDGK